jgi:HAD superfamily hydrolase (TIGR01509 family)
MNIIIPLCGKGERFFRKGYKQLKPLINVLGKEIIRHVIDSLDIGADDTVYIIINKRVEETPLRALITKHYPSIKFIVLDQETCGASETILKAIPQMSTSGGCLLVDGDNFYTSNIIHEINKNSNTNQIVCFQTHDEKPVFSYIKFNDIGVIETIAEKQKICDYANTGAYYFASTDFLHTAVSAAMAEVASHGQEPYISNAIATTLPKHIWKAVVIPKESYISLGTPEQVDHYKNRTYGYLFDLDGTLVHTDAAYFETWAEILAEYNIVLTKEIYDTYIYSNDDASVKQKLLSGAKCSLAELSEKKERLFLKHLHTIEVIAGAKEFIHDREKEAHKIAVVTNSNRMTAEAILSHIGICPDILVIGSECTATKPSPAPYLSAIAALELDPSRCFVFEDSKNGVTSGRNTNVKCVVGICGEHNYIGADICFPDFTFSVSDILNFQKPSTINYSDLIVGSLGNKYTVTDVCISPIQLKGGFIADVLSVKMKLDGKNVNAVLKLMNENDSPLNQMAHFLDLYGRENYFYESISPFVPVHTPKCYGLLRDTSFKTMGFILEDLRDIAVLNRDLNKEPIDLSLSVISHMAKLHASFWDKDLTKHFTSLRKNNDKVYMPAWKEFLESRIDLFVTKWKQILKPEHISLSRKIVENMNAIQDELSCAPLTLVHGDIKSPNIFYKGDAPYFIDWQYIVCGKGVQDLIFFMIESFSTERMTHLYPLFKNYYYVKLKEYGVTNYTFPQYEKDIKSAIFYFPFFVAVWFGTTPNSDLIDVNFPYFFIQRLFSFYDIVLETNI